MSDRGSRHLWGWICALGALLLLLAGWLVPIHLRGIDLSVLQTAGKSSNPAVLTPVSGTETAAAYWLRTANRKKGLDQLARSSSPSVKKLLRCRQLTNTVLFPPSSSASGQAFDTAVVICGLLLDGNYLKPALTGAISSRVDAALQAGDSGPMEAVLMDLLSLAQRFDWNHLVRFTGEIKEPRSLAILADAVRNAGNQLPELYAAVALSEKPDEIARYLTTFGQTGLRDLSRAGKYGAPSLNLLLERRQEIYIDAKRDRLAARAPFAAFFRAASNYAARAPAVALALKWFFYLSGGFLIALALQMAFPPVPGVPRLHFTRELLFALGVLLVALLLSEPYLAQGTQKVDMPFRLRLPGLGRAVATQPAQPKVSIMNTSNMTANLLTLALFFVLQALIFIACLSRLRETMRQNVPARVKLKLLENEEHLFDAGLYLGFVGTIVCLILVSLGVLQFSLMAAYSSTSFGIIFVSILKIFSVRPARRRLLLEAEGETPVPGAQPRLQTQTLATAP